MKPLWVGWITVVRILFHPWHWGPRRDRFTVFVFNHGPGELRRAYIWVGSAQNPRDDW